MQRNRLQMGLRSTFVGLVVNALLAGGKMAAGILGHSHALVADAVESMADLFSALVVWRGLVVAAAPADAEHPYGHGKAEPIAAAAVATVLLMAAIGITVEAIQGILHPSTGPAPFTLLVLLGVVLTKELLFRFVKHTADSMVSSAVNADAWHHRSDAITSLAAAIGISIALLGGPRFQVADNIAAMVAAVIIAWNGWRLLRPALDELMDSMPGPKIVQEVRETAAGVIGVERVEKCMVRKVGNVYFVDMHVEVAPTMTVQEGHTISHQVKDRVRMRLPAVRDVLVHIEPHHGNGERGAG